MYCESGFRVDKLVGWRSTREGERKRKKANKVQEYKGSKNGRAPVISRNKCVFNEYRTMRPWESGNRRNTNGGGM